MKKPFPTFLDETAVLFDEIYLSAGQRGAQIVIAPELLTEYLHLTQADLTKENR